MQRVVDEMDSREDQASHTLSPDLETCTSGSNVFAAPDNLQIAIPHLQSTLAGKPDHAVLHQLVLPILSMSHKIKHWMCCIIALV